MGAVFLSEAARIWLSLGLLCGTWRVSVCDMPKGKPVAAARRPTKAIFSFETGFPFSAAACFAGLFIRATEAGVSTCLAP